MGSFGSKNHYVDYKKYNDLSVLPIFGCLFKRNTICCDKAEVAAEKSKSSMNDEYSTRNLV